MRFLLTTALLSLTLHTQAAEPLRIAVAANLLPVMERITHDYQQHGGQPVQLAPTPGVGEVSWATPIVKNSMEVPIKDKADLLLGVNAAALGAGASQVYLIEEPMAAAIVRRTLDIIVEEEQEEEKR